MHRSLRLFRVEVYVPSPDDGGEGEWIFLEPSPGIKESDTETANSDDLDRDPRARWFCIPERMDGTTKVYATRFARSIASTRDEAVFDNGFDVDVKHWDEVSTKRRKRKRQK